MYRCDPACHDYHCYNVRKFDYKAYELGLTICSGTADQPETTTTEIIPVTERHDGETKIVIDAPSTDYIAGADKTVTAVRRGDTIDILEPKTIYNTVGRTTIELPTAYETVFTTDADYIGTTSVETILDVETQTTLVITDTVEIATSTGTDIVTETITSVESIPTTSTEYVVTGTDIKFAPRMRVYVTKSRTFVIYAVPSTRLHTVYTTTDYLTSTWTTVTVQSTEVDYTTIPTTTLDVTTAATTVEETIVTSTETGHATSTITTNEWTTETCKSARQLIRSSTNYSQLFPPRFTPRSASGMNITSPGSRIESALLRPLRSTLALPTPSALNKAGSMSLARRI